jgi:hypothetical protein
MRPWFSLVALVLATQPAAFVSAQESAVGQKQLTEAVEKLRGYVSKGTTDSGQPILRISLRDAKDGDLQSLRPLLLKSADAFELSLGESITDAGLAHLVGMKKLSALELRCNKITDAGMAHLKGMGQLEELLLQCKEVKKGGFAHLGHLKKLRKLSILYADGMNADGLVGLKDLAELRDLAILYSGTVNAKGTMHLAGLKNLRTIHFSNVDDDAFQHLKGNTNLQQLALFYSGIGNAGLEHLVAFAKLETLDLQATRVSDQGMTSLSKLTELRELRLNLTGVGDEGLKNLGPVPKLKKLWLERTKVTDNGLAHLGRMTALEDVMLDDCEIIGPGLKHLTGLARLHYLSLNSSRLTDDGIPHLKNLKSLKQVRFTGTRVNCDEAFALQKALPNTRVVDAFGHEFFGGKRPEDMAPLKFDFDVTKLSSAAKMSAKEFRDLLKKDSDGALKKFDGQALELTGTVASLGSNSVRQGYLRLNVDEPFNTIGCITVESRPWEKLAPGMTIKIKGKILARSYGDQLTGCVILESSAHPGIKMTAEELAKEYRADADAAKKKYEKKQLIISGEIVDRTITGGGFVTFQLKAGDARLECVIEPLGKYYEIRRWKIGQQVRMMGEFEPGFDKQARVTNCLPLPAP